MPRKLELTFQKGANGRTGRWKKFYHGKTHYLGSGRCKSDIESYKAALSKWRKLKIELDAEIIAQPKPHAKDYDKVIGEWELVLSWSVQHEEHEEAVIARDKLAELRRRREQPKPQPVTHQDRLWSRFRPDDDVLRQIGDLALAGANEGLDEFRNAMLQNSADYAFPVTNARDLMELHTIEKSEVRWKDRLENQKKLASAEEDQTLGAWIDRYLARRRQRIEIGELSAGRFVSEQTALHHFRDWGGAQVAVSSISSQTLSRFHAHQLQLIVSNQCAAGYARDRMTSVRTFIRWLWEQDAIESLPKNIDSKELKIAKNTTTPETLELAEVQELLKVTSGRTQLYILLGLNCGMTQKDISDLKQSEVDWRRGKITRKRSKTQKHDKVPTVTYKLWSETLELLREFRSDSDVVLLNRNGNKLLEERLDENGSYRKSDNIKNAYDRAVRKTSFSKPFKLLRKTSATLINANERFRGLDELFLGHAPATIAEKHYTATGESALDAALDFLRSQYKIETATS